MQWRGRLRAGALVHTRQVRDTEYAVLLECVPSRESVPQPSRTLARSMRGGVRVCDQPGLGLGLQLSSGTAEANELLAIYTADTLVSQSEWARCGRGATHALRIGCFVLDAGSARGAAAANEDADPNATMACVSLPAPGDAADLLVVAVFANRQIQEGEFVSVYYGTSYQRIHYPGNGAGPGAPAPSGRSLSLTEDEKAASVMRFLDGAEVEVLAYAAVLEESGGRRRAAATARHPQRVCPVVGAAVAPSAAPAAPPSPPSAAPAAPPSPSSTPATGTRRPTPPMRGVLRLCLRQGRGTVAAWGGGPRSLSSRSPPASPATPS